MEEVVGSIPTRSTKFLNILASSLFGDLVAFLPSLSGEIADTHGGMQETRPVCVNHRVEIHAKAEADD